MAVVSGNGQQKRSLLVDIGNTNLKWCWLKDGKRSAIHHAPHKHVPITELFEQIWRDHGAPVQILVANVAAPALNIGIEEWVGEAWNCPIRFLKSEQMFAGVSNAYQTPTQLGVDRWLTLVAARHEYRGDVCVVDCGTAVTIDLLKSDGKHMGGLILPGFTLMRHALLDKTHIPRVDSDPADIPLLGRDTQSAVAAASLYSVVALVSYVMREAESLLDSTPKLLLTGSDAERLRSGLEMDAVLDLELIMKGLAIYADEEPKL
jgi:type III pantothenate kinase